MVSFSILVGTEVDTAHINPEWAFSLCLYGGSYDERHDTREWGNGGREKRLDWHLSPQTEHTEVGVEV